MTGASVDASPGPDDGRDGPAEAAGGPAARSRVTLVAVALVTLAAGVALGLLAAGSLLRPAVPTDSSVDAGFARDMQVHHAQAVDMSVHVRDRSTDPAMRQLALDIMLTQQQQQGQMFGWLSLWGLPQFSSAPVMAWMGEGHQHAGGPAPSTGVDDPLMPGMATEEQMDRLAAADGEEADRIYLALMIPHHVAGVEMAEVAEERADQPAVRRLARAMVLSQEAEIRVLEEMLAERGGAPTGL